MAKYINPAEGVIQHGRKLPSMYDFDSAQAYRDLRRKAGSDRLVLVLDMAIRKNALLVEDEQEWLYAVSMYKRGYYISINAYALSNAAMQSNGLQFSGC